MFVQIINGTPGVNPSINYGLLVIIMCQCRFNSYNKRPTLLGNVDSGGSCVCVRTGSRGDSPCFSFHFAVKLKVGCQVSFPGFPQGQC